MTKLTQKNVMFDWGDKAEAAFQLLKQKLCSAPILALLEGAENFIVYCDASHKGLEQIKPLRVRALVMNIGLDLPKQILNAQTKARKPENFEAEDVGGVGCHALVIEEQELVAMLRTIDQSVGGKLRDRNAKESWVLLEDIALYDNESWNDPRDFAKSVKAISLPQVIPSTSDRRLIELENQVQRLMEAYIAPIQPTQSSLAEQNRNPSSPKRIHFFNSIDILNKEDEAKEEGNVNSNTTEYEDHEMTVESVDEFEEETKEEIKEEEEDSPKHFNTFPTMKEIRNFTYECDFVALEDTTSVIDHDPRSVVFRKPFVEATGLVYDKEEGTIMFEKDKEKIMFKMPHKMEMFKQIDFTNIKTDH
ncbi:MAK10-like protein [Tanacetum coccineum]